MGKPIKQSDPCHQVLLSVSQEVEVISATLNLVAYAGEILTCSKFRMVGLQSTGKRKDDCNRCIVTVGKVIENPPNGGCSNMTTIAAQLTVTLVIKIFNTINS